jgi:hypothetical protein
LSLELVRRKIMPNKGGARTQFAGSPRRGTLAVTRIEQTPDGGTP